MLRTIFLSVLVVCFCFTPFFASGLQAQDPPETGLQLWLDASDITNISNELGLLEDPHASVYTDDTAPSDEFVYYLVTPEDSCGNQS